MRDDNEVHTRVRRSTLAPDQGMSAVSSERNAPVVTVITLNTEGGMYPRRYALRSPTTQEGKGVESTVFSGLAFEPRRIQAHHENVAAGRFVRYTEVPLIKYSFEM